MNFLARQVVAIFMAALVLITSTICVCQGSPLRLTGQECHEEDSAARKPCCEQRQHQEDAKSSPCHHGGSGNPDSACNHCKGNLTATNDSTNAYENVHVLALVLMTPTLDLGATATIAAAQSISNCYVDLPPPVDPPTLLSLGCLLTI